MPRVMDDASYDLTSPSNPRIKDVVGLRKRRTRDARETLVVEGYREVRRALDNGYALHTLFAAPEWFLGENEAALIEDARAAGAQVFTVAKTAFARMSYRDRPDGLLGLGPYLAQPLTAWTDLPEAPLILVAEAIEKPGNLGTMLRSADAAGADAVLVCDAVTDVHNPNVVRASVGTLFTVPVYTATSEDALAWLAERGIRSFAATPHAESLYTDVNLREGAACWIGTEQYGLQESTMARCDERVRIPMAGQADSLNASASGTLMLFEAIRQRGLAAS